ncbi:hypothetical protein QBC33DRAFT_527957 [Phialemonium atrogriseum]|uniref:UBA domain-containing protein n=1 Tax=Phialemonium atrogriseum TaxID=1093897 RepID=A0AAJ0FRR2_9PEZI|nr:uncharacterized protein QBC33DRAFT_527957 [Phialemonium atrogriseum]KAK1770415.1 hypothetical protein QBC33DRAFT_527957 [Phialemonium atrogriseum]
MDDLTGLDWSSSNAQKPNKPPLMSSSNAFYPSLRPTPSPLNSGRNTPLSTQGSGNVAIKPPAQKPAQDSFSNLVNFGSSKSNANLSLREQQERLEAEKRRKEEEKRKEANAHYGDGRFWDTLGQRQTGSPQPASNSITPPAAQDGKSADPDDDLFAAFNANTKVDNSSYYPPPSAPRKVSPAGGTPSLDLSNPHAWNKPATPNNGGFGDDDDPFGLSQLKHNTSASEAIIRDEEDDFLGDLGKPVEEVRKQRPPPATAREPEPGKAIEHSSSDSDEDDQPTRSEDPFDRAVAQLVDYGFTPENARRGLTESGAGLNVQAAANWLLDDAHRQAKEKAWAKKGPVPSEPSDVRTSSRSRAPRPDVPSPGDRRSPALDDNDFTKTAAVVGSNLLKTANSLWKTGQKKVQQAVADFQQEGDPSQPKWMRSTQPDGAAVRGDGRPDATDEAMMLEAGMRPGRGPVRPNVGGRPASGASSRDQSPSVLGMPASRANAVPKWQQSHSPSLLDPRSRLHKQAVEEESSQVYVSPARRKKASPQPSREASRPAEPEADLLFSSTAPSKPAPPQARPTPLPRQASTPGPAPRPTPRPTPPARQIPSISSTALDNSTRYRLDGTAHFKRGDYAAAHASYTSSLAAVPQTHPLAILLLCNRALTALKTGEPRQAVADADTALGLIGEGKGEGEAVELGGADREKRDMHDLYGKALTRKAEALEQMEKWADAGTVWQLCVESGVGGPTAIAGRQRCQKVLAPKPAVKAKLSPRPSAAASRPRPRPAAPTHKSSDAVDRLRAANQAAEREGDEKFALTDKVDARIAAWRDGKRDNLRALLGSLDNVLWETSGWKKVGLHELVMANKVKIVYMKAIAKTHPDKLPQDANTEVRMIAGTVFATLNEAWDKFKAENGL